MTELDDDPNSHIGVVVLGYWRPDLLKTALESVRREFPAAHVLVGIDGLPEEASTDARVRHRRAIAEARQWTSDDSASELVVRDYCMGLVHHSVDLVERQMRGHVAVLVIEDDQSVLEGARQWISSVIGGWPDGEPLLASLFTGREHSVWERQFAATRAVLFPELWGAVMNRRYFEELKKTVISRSLDPDIVKSRLQDEPMTRYERWVLTRVIARSWGRAMASTSAGDGMMGYCLWSLGVLSMVPTRSFIRDEAQYESWGMNPRDPVLPAECDDPDPVASAWGQRCRSCEREAVVRRLREFSLSYRARRRYETWKRFRRNNTADLGSS